MSIGRRRASRPFTQIVGKQLGLLKETFPDVSRVTVLWNPANPVYQALQLREAQIAARTLRIELQLVEARTAGELEKVFAAVARRQPLLLMGDPLFATHRQRITRLAAGCAARICPWKSQPHSSWSSISGPQDRLG